MSNLSNIEYIRNVVNNGADALLSAPTVSLQESIGTVPVDEAASKAGELGAYLMGIDESVGDLRGQINDVDGNIATARFMWNEALDGATARASRDLLIAAENLNDGPNGVKAVFNGGLEMLTKLQEIKTTYDQLLQGLGELAAMQTGWKEMAGVLANDAAQTEADARGVAASL